MNLKNVILILIISTVSFLLLLLGGAAVMKYYPNLIGFPISKKDSANRTQDTLYVENLIKINENKYRQMEQSIAEKSKLFQIIDSLKGQNKKMVDSINQVKKMTNYFQDSVGKVYNLVKESHKANNWLLDSLTKTNILNKNLRTNLDLSKKKIDEQNKLIQTKNDSLENVNFSYFAKIYNNSEPSSVAKILEQIDSHDAAKILKLMQKKKAGKVIESMLPERAAAILVLSSND